MKAREWFAKLLGKKATVAKLPYAAERYYTGAGNPKNHRASKEIDFLIGPYEFNSDVDIDSAKALHRKVIEQALIDYFTRNPPGKSTDPERTKVEGKSKLKMYHTEKREAWDFLFSTSYFYKRNREIVCSHAGIDPEMFFEGVHQWRNKKLNDE